MSGINKAIVVGNLGRDPEVRQTANGQRLANMSVATSEQWTDKQSGEKRERTEWHRVVVFDDKLVEVAERYLSKGSKVYVEGKIQTRKFQGQDGQDRYSTEIVLQKYQGALQILSGGRSAEQSQQGAAAPAGAAASTDASQPAPAPGGEGMEDIPF